MRYTGVLLLSFLMLTAVVHSQKRHGPDKEIREKFTQLEKIKLIETLEMNEETTLRFFSRKSKFQKRHDEMMDSIAEKIDILEVMLKSARVIANEEYKSKIYEIVSLQEEIEGDRTKFINSLYDILRPDQVAKYIIFEKKFKEEIRRLIFNEREFHKQN